MTATDRPRADPDPATAARLLLRAASTAALATAERGASGAPNVSLVLVATDHDAAPILLLSDLAAHSRNIAGDDRVSLLIDGTAGLDNPLTGPRVSVMGRAEKSVKHCHRTRFLARHPHAAEYAGFGDFHVWRVAVESAHFVAGFGRVHTIAASDLLYYPPPALAAAEADIVQHMNEDHASTVAHYATALLGAEAGDAVFTGIDPEGCDIRVGPRLLRLDFDHPIADAEGARAVLIELARGFLSARAIPSLLRQ